jgi:hypothetical protein
LIDDVAFHAHNLGDVHDAARAIAQTRGLNDDIDRSDDHFPDRFGRQREAAHSDHGFHTADGFTRTVGVQRSHRAVVAGIHGLQKVKRFRAPHLAHDDPFRTHTQTVLDELPHRDLAFAFNVRRACLEAHNVRLLELKFRGVFAGDDPLLRLDRIRSGS